LLIKIIWLCTNEDKLYHPAAGEYKNIDFIAAALSSWAFLFEILSSTKIPRL
jgi:hypothetical protein